MNTKNETISSEKKNIDEKIQQIYEDELLGAEQKALSIIGLTEGLEISSVLEIGAGTGALLESLDKLGFAQRYYAIEPSKRLYDFVVNHKSNSRLVAIEQATLDQCGFADKEFDLVIMSHILEHVENPAGLLSRAMQMARFIVIELPLDGNSFGNFRAAVKSAFTRVPRHNNAAGHIQFFSSKDVRRLVYWCGGEVVRSRLYVPLAAMRQYSSTGSIITRVYRTLVLGLRYILGEQIFGRLYHGHYAVLARERQPIPETERTLWPSSNYYL